VRYPEARDNYVVTDFSGFGVGFDILYSGKVSFRSMLFSARWSLLIFPAIALFYLYRLGRYLANPLVAMLATVFFSSDPTLLAHSALVGTDSAACAGFLFGLYYLLRFIARPTLRRAAIGGIALALAITCKFSCLLLIPAFLVLIATRTVLARRKMRMLRRLIRPRVIAIGIAVCFLVIWAVYGFAVNPLRQQAMLVHEPMWRQIPDIVREQPLPMPSFWLGMIFLGSRAGTIGQATYLNGVVSYKGTPWYFPEALAVKEPVGFLLALLAAIVILAGVQRSRRSLRTWLLLVPILVYFAITLRSRYQLGIRHLLPILPLMYLFATMQFARIRKIGALVILIALTFVETAAIHPDYLAFFNIASGGPRHGERYLLDSNLDWGQDLFRLANWLKSDEAKGRPYSIRCAYASEPLLRELDLDPKSLTDKPHGLFAISKDAEHRFDHADQLTDGTVVPGEDYSWVSRYPVVKRIGYSIDVYDLDARDSPRK
jgi:hypothetical protein